MSLDEIGQWSEDKLNMLSEYLHAYAVIMNAQKRTWLRTFDYVDGFAGAGIARSKDPQIKAYLAGSPLRAINCTPIFDRLWFIDRNPTRVHGLRDQITSTGAGARAEVVVGDSNSVIRRIVSDLGRAERALAFLDPYGLQVDWATVNYLARTERVDVFINFSLMGVTRNLRKRGGPTERFRQDLKRVLLTTDWIDRLYVEQSGFWQPASRYRRAITARHVAEHYRDDLLTIFPHVSNHAIMTNSRGGPIYALILGSHRERAVGIMNDIIRKYQLLR